MTATVSQPAPMVVTGGPAGGVAAPSGGGGAPAGAGVMPGAGGAPPGAGGAGGGRAAFRPDPGPEPARAAGPTLATRAPAGAVVSDGDRGVDRLLSRAVPGPDIVAVADPAGLRQRGREGDPDLIRPSHPHVRLMDPGQQIGDGARGSAEPTEGRETEVGGQPARAGKRDA